MIDTDKYEGHTAGPWTAEYGDYTTHVTNSDGVVVASVGFELDKDGQLIADAPLLLAEVKRLREIINKAMQQHTVLDMREQLLESQCIDAEGQYESGHWERDEE
jgi:hypothetical protein